MPVEVVTSDGDERATPGALERPYPYFGGKARVAASVWRAFGQVDNYVEPFFGGGAVWLAAPYIPRVETVNDLCAFVANFWRATQAEPAAVADAMNWPVNECDLEARHKWLVTQPRKAEFERRVRDDPTYYDVQTAAWWCWGLCAWIGSGWCAGEWFGPDDEKNHGRGTCNGAAKLPHLGPDHGVHRQLPHLGNAGQGETERRGEVLRAWIGALRDRLRNVHVCCGDWTRVLGRCVTEKHGRTAIFLDPPYLAETDDGQKRDDELYRCEDTEVAHSVREWCAENGGNPALRIALCGYEGEHNSLEAQGWRVEAWKAHGGMGVQNWTGDYQNKYRERVWFSPGCLNPTPTLFEVTP